MAENETLDLGSRRNRRWRHLCGLIAAGESPAVAAQATAACLLQTMKKVLCDPMERKPQFPVADLLAALSGSPDDVTDVLTRCGGHQYADLLAQEHGAPTPQIACERLLGTVADRFLDQIGLEIVGTDHHRTFPDFRRYKNELHAALAPAIRTLAAKVASDPSRPPRADARSRATRAEDHATLLRESLLAEVRR